VPNYSEFFVQADAAAPADLSALNAFCTPFGIDCGFGPTRVLALGNADLALEEIQTMELGYKGLIAGRALMTVDYYNSRSSNFVTDLLPQLGTPLGRINPNFGPWQAPPGLPPAVAAQIRTVAPPILSNNFDGSNILAAASYTNFGRVDTQGVDVGFNCALTNGWRGSLAYSWFDFEIRDPVPGLSAMVLPNAPEHSFAFSIGYERQRIDTDFALRWVDTFRWSVGPFQGDVESYTTADVTANYRVTRNVTVGINVANVFDDQHWESFGGDILRRRALASLAYQW
jgi:outer membrane receptor protein involved in Fe transport